MQSTSKKAVLLIMIIMIALGLSAQHKPGVMFLKSLVVPGYGELSQGKSIGYAFIASEILLWGSMYYFQEESDLSERHAYEYALEYAHIKPGDYGNDYLHDLSKYDSSGYEAGGYNENVRRTAINLYPGDTDAQQDYIQDHAYSDELAWSWDDRDSRNTYTKHYKDIQHNKDYAQAMVGAIVLNHVVSGLNSLFTARNTNRRIEMGVELKEDMTPTFVASWRF